VQTGTITLADTASSDTVDRGVDTGFDTTVTVGKTVLFWGTNHTATTYDDGWLAGELTDGDTITFTRNGTSGAVVIRWWLVSWASGVKVQHKSITLTGVSSNTGTIDAGNGDGRFLVPSGALGTSITNNARIYCTLSITADTTVTCTRSQTSGNVTQYFQVVEYDGCTVQELTHTITTDTNTTVTDAITAVAATTNCLIIAMVQGSFTVDGMDGMFWTADFQDTSNVDFVRTLGDSTTSTFIYFVVEFTDGTVVQRNAGSLTNTNATLNTTISAVDTARSVALMSGVGPNPFQTGRSATTSSAAFDRNFVTNELTTTTNHAAVRGDSANDQNYISQVVQFAEGAGGASVAQLSLDTYDFEQFSGV